jgi:hypothetical protein
MKKDFTYKYFKAFSRIGVSTELKLFQMKGQKILSEKSFDHTNYDGLKAVLNFANSLGHSEFTSPRITYSPPLSRIKSFRELLRWYFDFFPFKASLWKRKKTTERVSAWQRWDLGRELTSSELNSKLLLSLDQTAKDHLQDAKKPRMWMIPVGLYPNLDQSTTEGNSVSFIDVEINDSTTSKSLNEQIRFYLKKGNYWGTLLTIKPAGFLGVWLFSQFLKVAHLSFRRTGTLTNVGNWDIPGLPQDEWWVFGDGMVARMNPVVGTALMVNGKLGVSIIFDASVGKSKDDAESFLNSWKMNFQNSL